MHPPPAAPMSPPPGPPPHSTTQAEAEGHTGATVFGDPTGRRHRRTRIAVAALSVLALLLLALMLPNTFASPELHDRAPGALLSSADTGEHAPVIGQGTLERVAQVRGDALVEPFTGADLGRLSRQEKSAVGAAPYVIQRYGVASPGSRTISLTFDDGPDALVTPHLLDVLSREHVPATFFLVGRNIVRNPEIVQRMTREGHAVGVHTMTHPDITHEPAWREQYELVGTERLIRHLTGHDATMWRMPYTAPDEPIMQETIDGLLRAQRLGYVHTSYDFDTLDWEHDAREGGSANDIPLPDMSAGAPITMLLHDAGGPNRERSVQYVERLVAAARAQGYTFTTLPGSVPEVAASTAPTTPSLWDTVTYTTSAFMFAWPTHVMRALFVVTVIGLIAVGLFQCVLVTVRRRRRATIEWPENPQVATSVVLAAYNEETVIERTLRALMASTHPVAEFVVVDDGSSDATGHIVEQLSAEDPRVVLLRRPNGGKATALNAGLRYATGDVIVTLDADTIVTPDTVRNLVRHFALDVDERLGAVAGVVRVGNRRRNLLTRWQALEYVTQIGLERGAQDALGAISIVPGACAAWRREAVLDAGGYSSVTLAEDCDLALTLHRHGWRITQDNEATALTEAPETVDDLLKQRVRWTFGTLQAMWNNRDMMFRPRYGWLGCFVLPNYVMSLAIPLFFLPFVAVMGVLTLQDEGPWMLVSYFLAFLLVQLVFAALAVRLLDEDNGHLLMVPIYRVVYEPLRAYLLYTSVALAITGVRVGWNKLERTGTVDAPGGSTAVTPGSLATAASQEITR